jgi:diketogulonate reductase-like aldo/keto reductase
MEALVEEGLVRTIGLQDASIEQLTDVMCSARITPVVNSLEVHPGNRNDALLAFCRSQVSRRTTLLSAFALCTAFARHR